MRRIFLGVLIALLTFAVSALLVRRNMPKIVGSFGSSEGQTFPDGKRVAYGWTVFHSSLEATKEFNEQLQWAADHQESTSCFDESGRRIGERVVVLLAPPLVPEQIWRIMWTQQSENSSEFFSVESISLSDARYFETVERQGWKKCVTTNE